MLIQGSLVHSNDAISTEGLLRFLADRLPDGRYFRVEPPPGIIMAAAIDWRVILCDARDLDKLAEALWECYESTLAPLQNVYGKAVAGILIQMKNEHGAFDQFILGNDVNGKVEFLARIDGSKRALFSRHGVGAPAQELAESLESGYWTELT